MKQYADDKEKINYLSGNIQLHRKQKYNGMYYEHPDKELYDLQEMADNSVHVQRARDLQEMADQYVQAKLKISQPDDPAEIEADSIANEILHGTNDIQKQENEENLENKNQKQVKIKIQKKAFTGGSSGIELPDNTGINNISGGKPFGKNERSFFENKIGSDFSDVKIHTGDKADSMAKSIYAKAFTKGNDIIFAKGQYQPGTNEGKKLLAHELVHTVQQGGGLKESTIYRDYDKEANVKITEMISEIKMLMDKKRKALDNGTQEEMDTINNRVDYLVNKLQKQGITLDKADILTKVMNNYSADQFQEMNGRIIVHSPGEPYLGQKLKLQLMLDYIPPGEKIIISWFEKFNFSDKYKDRKSSQFREDWVSVITEINKEQYNQRAFFMELDDKYWECNSNIAGLIDSISFKVEVSAGGKYFKQFYSNPVSFKNKIPEKIKIDGPKEIVKNVTGNYKLTPWTPVYLDFYKVVWMVDGEVKNITFDIVSYKMSHAFTSPGLHKINAYVYGRDQEWKPSNKNEYLSSAGMDVKSITADEYFDTLKNDPLTPKQPELSTLVQSIENKSIPEIDKKIAESKTQTRYWKSRKEAQEKRLEKIKKHAGKNIKSGYSTPIEAVLFPKEGGVQPLSIYLILETEDNKWKSKIIDVTSSDVYSINGKGGNAADAVQNVINKWKKDNEYPLHGTVAFRLKFWDQKGTFSTTTAKKRFLKWVDGILIAGGFVAGTLLMLLPEAYVSKAAGGIILTWVARILLAASILRSSYAIYERIKHGKDVLSEENVLDAVSIITAFAGIGGTILRSYGLSTVKPMMYRIGNWLIMSSVAADAGTFVYITHEAINTIMLLASDPTLDEGQKFNMILRVMTSLFLNGTLLIISNRDIIENGLRPSDFIKQKLPTDAKTKIDPGTRLDMEFELKKRGKYNKKVSALDDQQLLELYLEATKKERLKAKRQNLELIKIKQKIEAIKKQTFEQRKKELGIDPARGYIEIEGEVGARLEKKFGYFERADNPDVEWISLSGPYKGKTFDHFGLPQGLTTDELKKVNIKKLLNSFDIHVSKADYVILDYRYMTKNQIQVIESHIKVNNIKNSKRIIKIYSNKDFK